MSKINFDYLRQKTESGADVMAETEKLVEDFHLNIPVEVVYRTLVQQRKNGGTGLNPDGTYNI